MNFGRRFLAARGFRAFVRLRLASAFVPPDSSRDLKRQPTASTGHPSFLNSAGSNLSVRIRVGNVLTNAGAMRNIPEAMRAIPGPQALPQALVRTGYSLTSVVGGTASQSRMLIGQLLINLSESS
jgi:hypothetical protein